ncbi:AraC family transcriptional regulator [Acidaminobacter sp. JC074]|uniref:AraC family transcriptional regulator n=1 Tax=Acidaminobacter sp. JC074 TaxID=2530199 RepID=UPI001F0CF9B7|nr:AraC family transcriptional regulator [Acidaminobacter sp. JC074]MCH4886637.1 AraC family transcriptional regulator [Acidaminobacter sp. JC074]
MNNKEIILKSIDILEENLGDNISIENLAGQMGFSKFYFSRLFKAITGYSPKQYYQARKISSSSSRILETHDKVIDIALDYGFKSPEVYTRAFTSVFGITPSQARKTGLNRKLMIKRLTPSILNKEKHAIDKTPTIVDLEKKHLVGIQFYHDLSMVNDLSKQWQLLMDYLDKIPSKVKPLKFYQLQYWFEDMSDELFFFCAVEVEGPVDVSFQFTYKEIPSQRYLKFRHKGKANEVGYTYAYIFEEWLPQTDYKLPGLFNFEYYGDEYLGPYNDDSISEIYIPLKK